MPKSFCRLMVFTCLVLFVGTGISLAQPANDKPCNALVLTMPNPSPCPTWAMDSMQAQGNNFNASADTLPPGYFICQSGNNAPMATADVWYKFVATAERVVIVLSGFGQNGVSLYLRGTGCMGLIPINCEFVTSGAATLNCDVMIPGEMYYVRVFGGSSTDMATFNMKFYWQHPCDDCMQNAKLMVNPPPVSGHYFPGDTVEFTYLVKGYKPFGGDLLHGVVPDFGPGWDMSSLTPIPPTITSSGVGTWAWYNNIPDDNLNLYNGFFYDGPPNQNGNPSDNKGDLGNVSSTWIFRWKIRTTPTCTGFDDLNVNMYHFSDFETGIGTQPDCKYDADYHFKAILNCCEAPAIVAMNFPMCKNDSTGSVMITVQNQSSPYSCWVYNSNGFQVYVNTGQATPTFTITSLGQGSYTAITSGSSCVSGHNFRVSSSMDWTPVQTSYHCGNVCQNTAVMMGPSTSNYQFSWMPGSLSGPAVSQLCPNTIYTITVTNTPLTCTDTFQIAIGNLPPDDATFIYEPPNTPQYCSFDTAYPNPYYIAQPGGTFSWTGPPGNIDPSTGEIYLFPLINGGTYLVTYTTAGPCTATDTFPITFVQSPPVPAMAGPTSICEDQAPLIINVTNLPPFNVLLWDATGDFTAPSMTNPIVISSLSPGIDTIYAIYYDGNSQCFGFPGLFPYTVNPSPNAWAGNDLLVCAGYSASLFASGGIQYQWSPPYGLSDPDVQQPVANLDSTMAYVVLVTDANGCRDRDTVIVYVSNSDTCDVTIFNGISPNGDGYNDFWFIDGIESYPTNTVQIFNRWGDLVWKTSGYNNRDNYFKGTNREDEVLPAATYFYIIQRPDLPGRSGWLEITH